MTWLKRLSPVRGINAIAVELQSLLSLCVLFIIYICCDLNICCLVITLYDFMSFIKLRGEIGTSIYLWLVKINLNSFHSVHLFLCIWVAILLHFFSCSSPFVSIHLSLQCCQIYYFSICYCPNNAIIYVRLDAFGFKIREERRICICIREASDDTPESQPWALHSHPTTTVVLVVFSLSLSLISQLKCLLFHI